MKNQIDLENNFEVLFPASVSMMRLTCMSKIPTILPLYYENFPPEKASK